ncbi:MAG: helix-turn-helix transcriptional regulator [Bacteroidota bacterium]
MKKIFPFYSIGHFINQPDNPTEFEITRFGEMEDPDVETLHKHTFYEITWIEKGGGAQVVDYQEYKNVNGSLFFISPGQLHHFEDWQPLTGGSVFFTENFFSFNNQHDTQLFETTFLDNFYANPFLKPTKKEFTEILNTLDLLYAERYRKDYAENIGRSYLHILLAQIQRCIDKRNKNTAPKKYIVIYKKLKKLADENFMKNWTASDYARQLNITQHHLNLVSKEVTGKTTSELLRARSVLEAKRMLTFSDAPVSEIAADLGFYDVSYFAKIFKAETKSSPSAFRKAMSEKYRNL